MSPPSAPASNVRGLAQVCEQALVSLYRQQGVQHVARLPDDILTLSMTSVCVRIEEIEPCDQVHITET